MKGVALSLETPAAADSQQAFLDLLNQHRGLIHGIARGYADREADRQDLVQEIVYQLWRSYSAYRGESAPITWVYRVALNTAITSLRRHDRRPAQLPIETAAASTVPPSQGRSQEIEDLYRAIRSLNSIDRALVMCYLHDLSYKRIAAILGISESNVGVRLTRVKAKLQRLMTQSE